MRILKLFLAIIFISSLNLMADIICYDGFEYGLGTAINGQDGGEGWSNAWSMSSGVAADATIGAGLTWTSPDEQEYEVTGNAIRLTPTTSSVGFADRNFATITNVAYFSFLVSPLTPSGGYDYSISIGADGKNSMYLVARGWGLQNWLVAGFTEDNRPAALPLPAVGTTQLMVGKLDMLAGTCDFWSNPNLENPGAPSYTQTGYDIAEVNLVRIYQQSNSAKPNWLTNSFDEIRVGTSFGDVIPIKVPTDITASQGTYPDKVVISWTGVDGTSSYSVFRSEQDDSSTATTIGSNVTAKSFDDTTCASQVVYYYWVTSNLGPALFGSSVSGYCVLADLPAQPTNVVASKGSINPVIDLSWDAADKATKYVVYRSKHSTFELSSDISGEIVATQFSDTNVVKGLGYFYWIKAGNVSGWSFPSDVVRGDTEYLVSICYESFDYIPGTDLEGQAGGFGFDGAWILGGEGEITAGTEGLTYPGLQTSGKSALALGLGVGGSSLLGTRNTQKDFGASSTNSVWYSFLFQPYVIGQGHAFLIPNGSWDCAAGRYWNNFISLHNKATDIPLEQGHTYLLVVKSSANGTFLWVDPSLESEPLVGTAGASSSTSMAQGHALNVNVFPYPLGGTNGFYYDEIRVGNSWAEVTPNNLVENVQASNGTYTDKVAVTWTLRSDATSYVVYRNTTEDSSSAMAVSGALTTDSYDDTTATPGEVYFYWIFATFNDGQQVFSYSDAGYMAGTDVPEAPANVDASDAVPNQNYVSITFDASVGAYGYRVYRNSVDDYATAVNISGDILGHEYQDSSVQAGIQYFYWARANNASGWSSFSTSDSGSIPALLVAYYAMNELDSTIMIDSSENKFDGIYLDSPILGVASADAAAFKTAVKFDVSEAIINSNSPIRDLTNNFTVAMWVKPDEFGDNDSRYLMGVDSDFGGWSLQTYNDQVLLDITGKGNAWTGPVLSGTAWTHITFTYDINNKVRVFINGVPREDSVNIGVPATYDKCETYIADGGNNQLYFGSLDEIRVYNGVVSDALIAKLFVIPEPATLSMLLLSAIGLLAYRRR